MDLILPTTGDWKVGTLEELEAAIAAPMRVVPVVAAGLETYTWNIDHPYDSAMHGTDTEAAAEMAEMNVLYYDPKCASRSRVLTQITTVRQQSIKRFGQPNHTQWKHVNVKMTVEGVLFFDVLRRTEWSCTG